MKPQLEEILAAIKKIPGIESVTSFHSDSDIPIINEEGTPVYLIPVNLYVAAEPPNPPDLGIHVEDGLKIEMKRG